MYYFYFIYWYIPDRYSHKHILRYHMANICVFWNIFYHVPRNEKWSKTKIDKEIFGDSIRNFRSINKQMLGLYLWALIMEIIRAFSSLDFGHSGNIYWLYKVFELSNLFAQLINWNLLVLNYAHQLQFVDSIADGNQFS